MNKSMEILNDYADLFLDLLMTYILGPLVKIVFGILHLLVSPMSGFSPVFQALVLAFFAACMARGLGAWMKKRRDPESQAVFLEKMESIKGTKLIDDPRKRHMLKREINDSADELYMKIIMDRFFESGITFLFPMFLFLFFLTYDLFTSENLLKITGSEYIWQSGSGARFTTGYFYMAAFYGFYAGLALVAKFAGIFRKKEALPAV